MSDVLKLLLTSAIEHHEKWGFIWFGLIFWGSVLNAIFGVALGQPPTPALTLVAYASGFIFGLRAKIRGAWL